MILFENDVGLSRGDILVGNKTNFETKEVLVDIAWLDDQPFSANKKYILKQGTLETTAKIFVKSKDGKTLVQYKAGFYRGFMGNDPPPELNDENSKKLVKNFITENLQGLKKIVEKQ